MIGPLIVVALGFAVWKWVLPSERFLSDLSTLLSQPVLTNSRFALFSGRRYATGQFGGREVAMRLQLPRGENERGYLVIAIRTTGPKTLDNEGIEARADAAAKKALFDIAAADIVVNVEDGWLKGLWRPPGTFSRFPGRFSEEKWRKVLTALQTVAGALENDATANPRAGA